MEKKNNNVFLVFIVVVLLLLIGGLYYYIFVYDKETSAIVNNEEKNESKEEIKIDLGVDNAHVKEMFSYVHSNYYIGVDKEVYEYEKKSVSEMSDLQKTSLASNIYRKDVIQIGVDSLYIEEENVKIAYELVFGEGSYTQMSSIAYDCGTMSYDDSNQRYVLNSIGCGGASSIAVHDEVVEAIKYNDRIEIIAASVATKNMDGNFYKSHTSDEVVGNYTTTANTVETHQVYQNEITAFIKNNKDKLQQYTYTFKIDDKGFYYYTGFERTNR